MCSRVPALAAITAVTATKVTFTGPAASLPTLKVGDVISAGVSDTTPAGLLRVVTAAAPGGGTLVVTTRDAGLGEAVLQGSLSVGQRTEAPALAALKRPRLKHGSKPSDAVDECSAGGASAGLGFSVSCTKGFGGASWSASVMASASASLTFDAGISWGLPPSVHVRTTAAIGSAAKATASASAGASISQTSPTWTRAFPERSVVVLIGEVPVVIVPELSASVGVSGALVGGFNATAEMHTDASMTYDSQSGVHSDSSHGGSASGSTTAEAWVKGDIELGASLLFYGKHESYLSVGVTPYLEVRASECTIDGDVGADLTVGFSIGITKHLSVSKDFTVAKVRKTVFRVPWRDCAVWSGTMTSHQTTQTFDDLGQPRGDSNVDESVTLVAPPDGLPPLYQAYDATGVGSGVEHSIDPCDDDPYVLTLDWDGPVTNASGTYAFHPSVAPGYTVIWDYWQGSIDGTRTESGCNSPSHTTAWVFDFRLMMLEDPNAPPETAGYIVFATPVGTLDFSGTRVFDSTGPNGSTNHQVFTYDLHKTCIQGGSDC